MLSGKYWSFINSSKSCSGTCVFHLYELPLFDVFKFQADRKTGKYEMYTTKANMGGDVSPHQKSSLFCWFGNTNFTMTIGNQIPQMMFEPRHERVKTKPTKTSFIHSENVRGRTWYSLDTTYIGDIKDIHKHKSWAFEVSAKAESCLATSKMIHNITPISVARLKRCNSFKQEFPNHF